MTFEVPHQVHQKVLDEEDLKEKFRFSTIFLLQMGIIHFLSSVIHESAHIITCLAFEVEFTDLKIVVLGISTSWEYIEGLKGAIIALSGACIIAFLSLCVYKPLYSKVQRLFAKQICLIGIVQLSQEMFYWVFGSLLGGFSFPWRSSDFMIDPLYLANSLGIDWLGYVISLIFLPLFLLSRKLNKEILTDFCLLINVQYFSQLEWKSKFILHSTKIYIVLFQILNIITFIV